MKILIFGDIYGRVGRKAFMKEFPKIKEKYNPDFIIANIENISSGRGPIMKHINDLERFDIDLYTSGNHIFDNAKDINTYLSNPNTKLLRPANYYESEYVTIPGKGYTILEKNSKKILIINLMSSLFLRDEMYNPFLKADEILKEMDKDSLDAIIIDFHRETTSEMYAMSMFLDSKISFVYGTHTHVQTNDELIFPGGTGMLTDVGMSGPLFSIIGADFESLKSRFLSGVLAGKIDQALGTDYVVSGALVEIENKKCIGIEKIRMRGKL